MSQFTHINEQGRANMVDVSAKQVTHRTATARSIVHLPDTVMQQLANGHIVECDVVSSVELRFKNRQTTCRAMILPGDAEPLLGAIPLEDMDVLIHPLRQELIVNPEHPYFAQMKMK